jgi:chromosome segregation ATPase
MTEQVQEISLEEAQEQLNKGFKALRGMEANVAKKKKQIEERLGEIHNKIGNLQGALEVAEITGSDADYKKNKTALDKLRQEEKELNDRLSMFSRQAADLPKKLQNFEGEHREAAKSVDQAAHVILNDLADQIADQQEKLRQLANQYKRGVQELARLAHQAGDTAETANYARHFLPKAERVPVDQHKFRANHVTPNWEIKGEEVKPGNPQNHVTG